MFRDNKKSEKLKLLFLCVGNSCRSQIAEGFARSLKGGQLEVYSAGIKAKGVDPLAVRVMNEAGIDISNQTSKNIEDLPEGIAFDYVITLCSEAEGVCPVIEGDAVFVHKGFDDPPSLASEDSTEEEALFHYRRVRDEIKEFVKKMPDSLYGGEDE